MELKLRPIRLCSANSGSTNRTKVELKRLKATLMWSSCTSYQSYQSGIETPEQLMIFCGIHFLPIVPKWNWNFGSSKQLLPVGIYQSYQSGIETGNCCRWFHQPPAPTNRTKVELKQKSGIHKSMIRMLPIVPKWNWNFHCASLISINGSSYQSYQSGIETTYIQRQPAFLKDLPIVPKWNWNVDMYKNQPQSEDLPIVPKWNWNSGLLPWAFMPSMSTNRTKVELKRTIVLEFTILF